MISSEKELEHVEKRLLTDKDYYENLQSIEDELIQYYADGKLAGAEKEAFEARFTASREGREKIKFARLFRNYLDDQPIPRIVLPEKESIFTRLFSLPSLQFLTAGPGHVSSLRLTGAVGLTAILVVFSSFFAWNWYTTYGTRQGIALLNKAYEHERPLESRISELNYARYFRMRSADESQVDKLEVSRARQQIQDNGDPVSLARLYLTEKDFDAAIQQLEKALKKDPENGEIYNDLGVAYLEKGQVQEDKGNRFKLTVQAFENFDTALRKKPDLLAALFNKARCLEALPEIKKAKEAWQEYLKHDTDPSSPWAAEAKDHLKDLVEQTSNEMTPDEFEQAFLDAAAAGKDEEAFKLASLNREMIKERFLPQKLAMSFLQADEGRADEILRGLTYLGKLEKERIQDNYTSDLAAFYSDLPEKKKDTLRSAQQLVREGYQLCFKNKWALAAKNFTAARELFLQAGDEIEAKTVGTYFIAYVLNEDKKTAQAADLFKEVDEFSRKKNYQWFALMNLDWLIIGEAGLGRLLSSDVADRYKLALKKAEEMGDVLTTQKFLRSLNSRNFSVKDFSLNNRDENTFAYLQRIFEYSGQSNVSTRQKDRGFASAFKILAFNRYTALAKVLAEESVESQENMEDPKFLINAQKATGVIYTQTSDFPEAERWLNEARLTAEELEGAQRPQALTEIMLNLGELEEKKNNNLGAIKYYDQALQLQQEIDSPTLLYEVRKSRLLAYEALDDDAAVEKDLREIIPLAEEKRQTITSEQDRNTFFSYEQEVYDVAIEHASRADNSEQAFNYAETSSSRSLLDQLQNDNASGTRSAGPATPLTASQIRDRIPANVQLLQYAVLKDRVLIWVISRDKFEMVSSDVNLADLKNKIELYISQITSHDRSQQDQARGLAQEFYNLLITPVLPHLDKDKEICLIPNKILFNLSFAALVSPSGRYFLQDFDLFYSPSANVFILSTQKAKERSVSANESLLAIGDPAFDRQRLPGLPDLPESIKEVRSIAGNYSGPKVLVGNEATKKAFRQAMAGSDVIHFAGHYLAHPEAPSELVMAKSLNAEDNFFTNSELMSEKLPRTRLVVLSACQTGVESYYNGEGLVGLSRTFLSLSVPLVVASQWPVESGATAELMKKFHRYRKLDDLSSVKALRKAQLEMVNAADERFRSPYYWASFAAFGGYAEF
jgi:CHAT domain-containing protein/cytochrome c-type biogenesis protein CcmH/NrfG